MRDAPTLIPLHLSERGQSCELGWRPLKPASAAGERDYRWLKVAGRIRTDDGEWCFVDESLTERESRDLVLWLRRRPWPTQSSLDFIEPCLEFHARGERDGRLLIAITFRGEVSPPWIQGDADRVWGEGYTVEWLVSHAALSQFADGLAALVCRSCPSWRAELGIGNTDRVV